MDRRCALNAKSIMTKDTRLHITSQAPGRQNPSSTVDVLYSFLPVIPQQLVHHSFFLLLLLHIATSHLHHHSSLLLPLALVWDALHLHAGSL